MQKYIFLLKIEKEVEKVLAKKSVAFCNATIHLFQILSINFLREEELQALSIPWIQDA